MNAPAGAELAIQLAEVLGPGVFATLAPPAPFS